LASTKAFEALMRLGQRDTVLKWNKKDTQILKAKADWERKACLFLERNSPKDTSFQDAAVTPNGFHHNRRDLPKLAGNVKDWLPFWALFKEVDEDRVLTDVQKMQLLLQSTSLNTEPREVVSCYTVTNNYAEALAHLKDLYGRDNVLIKVYVRELLQLALDASLGKKMEFRKLVTSITAQVKNLEMLGVAADKFAQILYPLIEACLPKDVLKAWQHSPEYADELEKLMKFLKDEVNHETERNLAHFNSSQNEKSTVAGGGRRGRGSANVKTDSTPTAATLHNNEEKYCVFCDNCRHPRKCRVGWKLTVEERKDLVKKKGACFTCLEKGHRSFDCPNKEKIKCDWCSRRHLKIMCPGKDPRGQEGGKKNEEDAKQAPNSTAFGGNPPPKDNVATFQNAVENPDVPLQIIPIIVTGSSGKTKVVRALLDSGSQKSYIVESLQRELQFPKIGDETVAHQLFGGTTTQQQHHEVVKLHATGVETYFPCTFNVSCIGKISSHLSSPAHGSWMEEFRKRGVTFPCTPTMKEVEVLIGNDVVPRLYTGKIEDLGTGPVAMETKWGWVLCGKLPPTQPDKRNSASNLCTTLSNMPLSTLWELDTIGILDEAAKQSKEELAALTQQHFEDTVTRTHEGRYEVSLPFIAGTQELLPTNFHAAEKRLKAATQKLKSMGFLEKYDALFKLWEENEMIEDVTDEDVREQGHYLPHRPVVKLSSATTPIRPVFDASAKPKGKLSLNDCLETGPNLLEKIPSLLTKLRLDKIAMTADIAKAFQQISVNKNHRNYLKFLWWSDPACTKLKVYRHTRVTFGVNCSPFLLGATLIHHLKKSPPSHEKTAKRLVDSFYVDNVVASMSSMPEAREFQQQSQELLEPALFDLRGWEFGPNPHVDKKIPILGSVWDMKEDTLALDITAVIEKIGSGKTQREILSLAHMLYDTVGFAAPFTILAKMILRRCHDGKLGWDTPVPPTIQEEFQKWSQQIPLLRH